MAQGILMERSGLSVPEAFDVLRRYSMDQNQPLSHVAEQIVTTRHLPALD